MTHDNDAALAAPQGEFEDTLSMKECETLLDGIIRPNRPDDDKGQAITERFEDFDAQPTRAGRA